MTFTVLAVCAANVCRSPLVAALLLQDLGGAADDDVWVTSAGVSAVDGQPMCRTMARLDLPDGRSPLLERAVLEAHRSRRVTTDLVRGADLVLAADRHVRSEVVKLEHRAADRTFTLREAAQLSNQAPFDVEGHTLSDRLRAMTDALNRSRGFAELPRVARVPVLAPPWRWPRVHAHDVPDAHLREQAPHRLVHDLAVRAAGQLAARVAVTTEGRRA